MAYGKLVNGQLVPAPDPLKVGNGEIRNPSGYIYEAVGYRRIIDTPIPETMERGRENCLSFRWEERDGQIVKVWMAAETPESSNCGSLDQATRNSFWPFLKK